MLMVAIRPRIPLLTVVAYWSVSGGGTAVDITQNSGGVIDTNTYATLSGTNINGSFSIANGSASNMLLEEACIS